MLEIARRRWREHESGNFQRAGAEICSVRAADSSGGARISAKMLRQLQRSKVRCRRHRLDHRPGKIQHGWSSAELEIMSLTPSIATVVKTEPVQSSVIAEIGYDADRQDPRGAISWRPRLSLLRCAARRARRADARGFDRWLFQPQYLPALSMEENRRWSEPAITPSRAAATAATYCRAFSVIAAASPLRKRRGRRDRRRRRGRRRRRR